MTRRHRGRWPPESCADPSEHEREALRPAAGDDRAGQSRLEPNSTRIVRTMFVLYTLLIVGGIVFFVAVGLTQQ
jgi:hypothetical protein